MLVASLVIAAALAAPKEWPREARDSVVAQCAIGWARDMPDTPQGKQAVNQTCSCVANGLESVMTPGQMYDMEQLSEAEQDAHPLTNKAADIMKQCADRYL